MNQQPAIDEIFCTAIEIELPEQRQAYLERACGPDTDLQRQVKRLLDAHFRGGSIVDAPAHAFGATRELSVAERSGTQIGPYKLLQQIGEGGMGVVYMAEQTAPVERRVALKIIKPGMDTRQVIARFEAERQALAMMDHPNIAKAYDAGQTDSGRPFFVMEMVNGIPITQYCDEQHLRPRERLELFVPVCQAIQHAHQKGIIHRDIKPSNVMIAHYDDHPVPKIIDFGVAKACQHRLTERTLFTEYGQIVGTLEYMSPEQARLNQRDIDTRTDIYSLGVLLYELLTGETPFDRTRLRSAAFDELLRIIREEEPPRPSVRLSSSHALPTIAANRHVEPRRLSALIRGDLDWIVMKAMEKDRMRRYDSASGLSADIRRYLNDEPVVACPPSAAYRFRKFARRNWGVLATLSLVGVVLLAASLISGWEALQATRAEHLAMQHLAAEQRAHENTRAAELETRHQLFHAYSAQANATRLSGRPGQRLDALESISKAVQLMEPLGLGEETRRALRDEAIGSLELADLRPARTWHARQNLTQGPTTLSRDFELLAFSEGETIHIGRVDDPTNDVARTATTAGQAQYLGFDPTKQYLLRLQPPEHTVYVTEIATSRDIVAVPDVNHFLCADFHPRRPRVAIGNRHGVVRCFDMISGEEIKSFPIGGPIWSLKYDPEGNRLAVGSDHVDVCDAETGEVVFHYSPPQPGTQTALAWRPDGKWLAVGTTPDIHLFEIDRAEGQHQVLHGHRSTVTGLEFHPTGQFLGSSSWDGTTRIWDSVSGQQMLRLDGSSFRRFSSDGRLMALLEAWDVALFEVIVPCAHRWLFRGMTASVAVAPGDRMTASCHRDGVRLWDLDRLEQVAHLPIDLTDGVTFQNTAGQLVTAGNVGLYRWPIVREQDGSTERIQIGPPESLAPELKNMRSAKFSSDGNTLLSEAFFRDEAFLLRPAEAGLPPVRLTRPGLSLSAISPDGRWVAASSSTSPDVRVWNATNGEHVCDLSTPCGAQICFSLDGRTVITNSGPEVRIWEAGTWKPRHTMSFTTDAASAIAFTPDSQIAAIGVWGTGAILVDVDTGRRIATLDLPEKPPVYVGLNFTSDGSRLVAAVDHTGCCIWDIRALREQLATLDLDWNQPPLPKGAVAAGTLPLHVEVDLGELAEIEPASPADEPATGQSTITDEGEGSTDG